MLDITGLGHGDDGAVLDVEDTVLLKYGTEHGLNDNARAGVGNGGRLLVELLGEQVDTEVAVLAGGSRGGDTDDLAGATLEDQDVTQADVVTGDGDGVGANVVSDTATRTGPGLPDLSYIVVVIVTLGVDEAISHLVDAAPDGVVAAW